jgi:hypothetical protein
MAELKSILFLVRDLCRRPRIGELPARAPGQRTRRRGLPMLCLVRADDIRDPVRDQIHEALHTPQRVPHALLTLDPGPSYPPSAEDDVLLPAKASDVPAVRAMLAELAAQFKRGANAGAGRIRFGRFGLLTWLMDQRRDPDETKPRDPDQWLRDQLRTYDLQRLTSGTGVLDTLPVTGWAAGLARTMLRISPRLWSALRRTGRIPLIGGKYRWFLRKQPYLTPRDPGSFLGFAERLTGDEYRRQDPDQLLHLLVHAFLDDLRRAFGHRHWPWRLRGARRTAYLVTLLDGISRDNRGYRLLKLVNDVRTDTGQFDPLLVIATSQMVPPYAREPTDTDAAASDRYADWRDQFTEDSRAGKPNAWYLPLTVTRITTGTVQLAIARPPWWSRRWVPVMVMLCLAGLAGVPTARSQPWGHWLTDATIAAGVLMACWAAYALVVLAWRTMRRRGRSADARHGSRTGHGRVHDGPGRGMDGSSDDWFRRALIALGALAIAMLIMWAPMSRAVHNADTWSLIATAVPATVAAVGGLLAGTGAMISAIRKRGGRNPPPPPPKGSSSQPAPGSPWDTLTNLLAMLKKGTIGQTDYVVLTSELITRINSNGRSTPAGEAGWSPSEDDPEDGA